MLPGGVDIGELGGVEVGPHEVLLLAAAVHKVLPLARAQLVVQSATSCLGDLVVGVRPSDFVCPLHLISLDHEGSNFGFSIHSWCERDHEVGSILAIGLELPLSWCDLEFSGTSFGEAGNELSVLLHVVRQSEGDSGSLLKRGLDSDDVVDHGLTGFENYVELPATTTALVNYKFALSFEWLERLESHCKLERFVCASQLIVNGVKAYSSVNKFLLGRHDGGELVVESVIFVQDFESRQLNLKVFIKGLAGSCLEVEISDV